MSARPANEEPPAARQASRWTAGSVLLVVLGSIVALVGAALLVVGVGAIVLDQTERDDQGFLMSPAETFSGPGYAIVSESVDVSLDGPDWVAEDVIGTVKIETESTRPVFVGIAREEEVDSYLGGVQRSLVTQLGRKPSYERRAGGAPPTAPGKQTFWAASATGSGTRTLTWEPESGNWSVVLMNADGSRGVDADASIGAEIDALLWIGIVLLVVGAIVVTLGVLLILTAARRARP